MNYFCIFAEMNIVLRHIEFLLSRRDCVVVPGLGAFIAQTVSAAYDESAGKFEAPMRKYTFNGDVDFTDGTLAMSLSRGLAVSYETAVRKINEAVTAIKDEMRQSGEFTMGRIGRLHSTDNGAFEFEPFSNDMLSPLSGWAGVLSFEKCSISDNISDDVEVPEESTTASVGSLSIRRFVRNTMGAAAAVLLALVVSTPVSVKNTYTASTVPPVTPPSAVEVPVYTETIVSAEEVSENPSEGIKETAVAPTIEIQPAAPEQPAVTSPIKKQTAATVATGSSEPIRFEDADQYILIVGSFASLAEANEYVDSYSKKTGLKLGVAQSGPYCRVYAATGATSREAAAEARKADIAKYYKSTWAAKRN